MITIEIIIREHPEGAGMQFRCYGNDESTKKEHDVADLIRTQLLENMPVKLSELPNVQNVIALARNGK